MKKLNIYTNYIYLHAHFCDVKQFLALHYIYTCTTRRLHIYVIVCV